MVWQGLHPSGGRHIAAHDHDLGAATLVPRPRWISLSWWRWTSPFRWIRTSRPCSGKALPRPSGPAPCTTPIRSGALGKIAVDLYGMGGRDRSEDHRALDDPRQSRGADGFRGQDRVDPLRRAQRTSISAAIDFSVKLLEGAASGNPAGDRRVGGRPQQPGPARRAGARRSGRQGDHGQRLAHHAAQAWLSRHRRTRLSITRNASSEVRERSWCRFVNANSSCNAIKTKILLEIADLAPA